MVVHAQGHHHFRAREVAGDLYAAIDLAVEKLQLHLLGRKTGGCAVDGAIRLARAPLTSTPKEPVVTRISRVTPRTLSVSEAARALDDTDMDFLLFLGEDDAVRVLYRRQDGTYGLLGTQPLTLS